MHDDELPMDASLVRAVLRGARPDWAELEIEPIHSTGTSNSMFKLGADMVARFPLRASATSTARKEAEWLPRLAPHLPLPIPVPVLLGEPSDLFPLPWSVVPWFEGEDATATEPDLTQAATDLAQFMRALMAIDPTGAPRPTSPLGRGIPLADRDNYTRHWIAKAGHLLDRERITELWQRSLDQPVWDRPDVWVHGDIASGNLLFRDGRLCAVIDFSPMGIGDPACDLIVAWELFDASSRSVFREALGVDEATWERGRGWALSTAVDALVYYEHSNRYMADQARRKLRAVTED